MASKGLPGFLRRSLRVKYDEEEDVEGEELPSEQQETEDYTDASNGESSSSSQQQQQQQNTKPSSNTRLDRIESSSSETTADHINRLATPDETSNGKGTGINETTKRQHVGSRATENGVGISRSASDDAESLDSNSKKKQPPSSPTKEPIRKSYRDSQFDTVVKADVVSLQTLRPLAWNGIPPIHRAMTWKLLLGYLPTNASRRAHTLQRKRAEYGQARRQHYDIDDDTRTLQEQETLRQVLVDVPRTAPDVPLFRNDKIRRLLSRVLYIWAMRHPASSYVQGINDLATPLLVVFLADYYYKDDDDENDDCLQTVLQGHVMNHLTDERVDHLEADVYGCLTNLLAGIQDHYTADQPGVQRMVMRVQELVQRIDADLCAHLEAQGIMFLQFAFKWMNCLLLREFALPCVVRLWDTYLSESHGFEHFHVYVCAAFLCQFSTQLQTMAFEEMFGFLQDMPTSDWGDVEIEMLLSQAYVLSTLFGGADAHLIQHHGS